MKVLLVFAIFLMACQKPAAEVVTTESGLKYKDSLIGSGNAAKNMDHVTLNYIGWVTDKDATDHFTDWSNDTTKSFFENSYQNNRPFAFPLGQGRAIKGWDEGIVGMKVGGKRTLIIPPELGYGDRPSGKIPANSTLKFQVELMEIDQLTITDDTIGTGALLKDGDMLKFHYRVTRLKDNSEIINTYEGSPQTLKVGDKRNHPVFKQLMDGLKVGGKRTAIVPGQDKNKVEFQAVSVFVPKEAKMWDLDNSKAKATKSGLKYLIVEQGKGAKVVSGKQITVHYSGFLEDGKKFDSSIERDEPIKFPVGVGRVIPGWDEGLLLLNVGTKARFIIPPKLGYGERGSGPIPPNSTLIFDVEVIDIAQ